MPGVILYITPGICCASSHSATFQEFQELNRSLKSRRRLSYRASRRLSATDCSCVQQDRHISSRLRNQYPNHHWRLIMKRLAVLSGLLLAGAISLIVAKPQQQNPPAALEIQKVKDNLYVITNGGGNTAAFITEKGVVVVDTKNPGNGPGILEKIKSVTPKPVIMVINTHTHGDHVGSNSAFTGAVEFVAHENCKEYMEKMPAFQSEEGKKFLPGKTYRDKLSLLSGKNKIELYYFGRGHTSGDTLVVFTALKTMHTGDLFATKGAPLI